MDWVGTSMGGLIGIGVAGTHAAASLRKLVLNDVGPVVQWGRYPAHQQLPRGRQALCIGARSGGQHVGSIQQLWPAHACAVAGTVAAHARP